MNLDHDFFQVSKLSEDQKKKKRSSPKMEHFFSRIQVKTKKRTLFFPEFKWRPALRCTPESNYWGVCRCRPYSNYWGGYSQVIGGTYHPIPPSLGFGTPAGNGGNTALSHHLNSHYTSCSSRYVRKCYLTVVKKV